MNELLNALNLSVFGAESPPGVSLQAEQSTGADGFAVMLSQLGQPTAAPVLQEMTEAGTKQGEISPAAQVALLQLLASVGLTGQQQAMDGSFTGSLPIITQQGEVSPEAQVALLRLLNSVGMTGRQPTMDVPSTGSLPTSVQQGFDLMNLNLGASPVEALLSARQLLASAIPALTDRQPIIASEQQSVALLNGAENRLPVDFLLSSSDLAKLQAILSEALSTSPQPVSIQPNLSPMTSDKSLTAFPEKSPLLGGFEQLLKEQFPTLNIENLSAQLHLKSPELVKTDVAPNALFKMLPSDGLSAKPSAEQPVSVMPQQATPQDRPQLNGVAEILPFSVPSDLSAGQTAAAVSSSAAQPVPTVAVSQATPQNDAKKPSDLTITPEIVKTVEKGNLEKTAVKAADDSNNFPQTAQHWNKLSSDHLDLPVAKQMASTEEPQIDKTKFRIQFDRFQIDALLQRSEIKLQLHPTNLGSMRVKLVSTSQEVIARFETTSEAARNAVEQNLPQLRESLEKAGIKVDHVEVVLDEHRARQQQSQYQNQKKHFSGADTADDSSQRNSSAGGGGISTAVQSMLGSLNLLA
jgi:flagellar hook-length control protein FliK